MGNIHLTICLTPEYRQRIEKIREDPVLRKCRSWTDLVQTSDGKAQIELTRDRIILKYRGSRGEAQESCTYDGVLALTERRDGILLRLSHKRLLFLPVTKDPGDNERLMRAMLHLCEHCRYIFREGRLRLPGVSLGQKLDYHTRPRQGHYMGNAGIHGAAIALICLTLFIATMFVRMPLENRRIGVREAVEFSGRYDCCEPFNSRRSLRYIDIQFLDGQEHTVDGVCSGHGLADRLEALPRGTQMELLLHPDSGAVLQIEAEGEILLEFDFALDQLWREAVLFAVLGLAMYAGDAFLLVSVIRKKL